MSRLGVRAPSLPTYPPATRDPAALTRDETGRRGTTDRRSRVEHRHALLALSHACFTAGGRAYGRLCASCALYTAAQRTQMQPGARAGGGSPVGLGY